MKKGGPNLPDRPFPSPKWDAESYIFTPMRA
jgi:hypothetical protein